MKQRLRILDTNFAHGTSLGSGDLKIYPTFFEWVRTDEQMGDVVILTDTQLQKVDRCQEKIKIAWLLEPACVYTHHHKWIKENYKKFDYVLTYNEELLETLPNAKIYYYGGCWINPRERKIYPKTKKISIIVSDKQYSEAQRMRHRIVREFKDSVDIYGRGYNPVMNKLEALRDYEYSIVIENEKSKWWMTEKVMDCFATGTIPIYRGCTNITDFLSETSIEEFDTMNQVGHIIDNILSESKISEDAEWGVHHNFEEAKKYYVPEDWLYKNFFKPKGILP